MLDLTGRAYYVTGMGGGDPAGSETIDRLNMGLTVRIYGRHALGLQYIASVRDARYPDRADSSPDGGNRQPRLHITRRHPVRRCRVARC